MKFKAMMRHDGSADDLSGTYVDGEGVRRTVKDGLADPRDVLDWGAFVSELDRLIADKIGFINCRDEAVGKIGGKVRWKLFPDGKFGCGVLVWICGRKSDPVFDEKVDNLKVGFMMSSSVHAVWDSINEVLKRRTGVGVKIIR